LARLINQSSNFGDFASLILLRLALGLIKEIVKGGSFRLLASMQVYLSVLK